MLLNRIVSVIMLMPVTIFILFFASLSEFVIFLMIVSLISSWEWGKLMNFSPKIHLIWMYVIFGLFCIAVLFLLQKFLYFNYRYFLFSIASIIIITWILMLILILSYPYSAFIWKKSNILRFCFGILIIFPFFCGVLILHQFNYINDSIVGQWFLLYILTLVWINDSCAYFFGRIFGQHKLLENVSPNKTWEGCIIGVLISSTVAWLLARYIIIMNIKNFYIMFLCFVVINIFAVIGDLTESMFKRESNVKDTSDLIPGHGGLLDRIDSLIAVVPIFTVLILFLTRINLI